MSNDGFKIAGGIIGGISLLVFLVLQLGVIPSLESDSKKYTSQAKATVTEVGFDMRETSSQENCVTINEIQHCDTVHYETPHYICDYEYFAGDEKQVFNEECGKGSKKRSDGWRSGYRNMSEKQILSKAPKVNSSKPVWYNPAKVYEHSFTSPEGRAGELKVAKGFRNGVLFGGIPIGAGLLAFGFFAGRTRPRK